MYTVIEGDMEQLDLINICTPPQRLKLCLDVIKLN